MQIIQKYRDNGAIGALLDEYEKALRDLNTVLDTISQTELVTIVDAKTSDANCYSIQTILTHLVCSGYAYAIYVRKKQGETLDFKPKIKLDSITEYQTALDKMLKYNEQLFADYPDLNLEELEHDKKVLTSWGQVFDIDQLFEHAIMHICRHRRQIERFLLRLR